MTIEARPSVTETIEVKRYARPSHDDFLADCMSVADKAPVRTVRGQSSMRITERRRSLPSPRTTLAASRQ